MTNIPARVSLVTLAVRDFQKMCGFYRALGWPESSQNGEGFAAFLTGGAILALWPIENFREARHTAAPDSFRGVMLAINVETPELVDVVLASAGVAGAQIVAEAADAFWGGRSGEFTDPEGNLWEVTWAPGTSFDERGGLIFP
jgi:catechol 2,3-dioxygenase-like lactoylglutathione lyase family enzyme